MRKEIEAVRKPGNMGFSNCYQDVRRADAYATLEFANTYYMAYRDLPAIIAAHVTGSKAPG